MIEIARISGKPVLSLERQEMINPTTWSGIAAIQKFRNFSVHAEMSDSPLVNRQAFKRKLRPVLPEPLFVALRRLVEHFSTSNSAPGTALVSQPKADSDLAKIVEQTEISGAHAAE